MSLIRRHARLPSRWTCMLRCSLQCTTRNHYTVINTLLMKIRPCIVNVRYVISWTDCIIICVRIKMRRASGRSDTRVLQDACYPLKIFSPRARRAQTSRRAPDNHFLSITTPLLIFFIRSTLVLCKK